MHLCAEKQPLICMQGRSNLKQFKIQESVTGSILIVCRGHKYSSEKIINSLKNHGTVIQ